MPRPCTCDRYVGPKVPWDKDKGNCVYCYQYHHDARFRAYCDGRPAPPPPPVCRYLGEPTDEFVDCAACGQDNRGKAKVKLKLVACGKHNRCTTDRPVEGVACCKGCPDYDPEEIPAPVVRNLVYHIAPASGNGVWQRNVQQLLKRIHLFNGHRVVAIVKGHAARLDYKADFKLDPPEDVMRAFKGHVHEFIVLPNNPRLREVVTFIPLLERVAITDPHHITFYAHAKGVTRPVDSGVTVHRWTDIMYAACLDNLALVERQLSRFPITGSFKKRGFGFEGSRSAWHYSGSFYWLRNSLVFSRVGWREVDQQWWGNESWPGLHFSRKESGCLFHEAPVGTMDMFSMHYLTNVVEPEWRSARVAG